MEFVDFGLELVQGGAQRARQSVVDRQEARPSRAAGCGDRVCVEEGDLQAVAGGGIAVRLGNAVDQAFETEPAQVVGHLGGGVRAPEECFDVGPEVAVAEAAGQMGEAA